LKTTMRHHATTEVVIVHDGFSARETWPFECLHCRHVWEEEYVVRHLTDGHGNDVDIWLRREVPVQPPLSGAQCPGCHSTSVTAFPRGYLSRHPELLTPAARIADAGTTGIPVGPDDRPARGLSLAGVTVRMLCVAVVVASLVLAAGYEIFERVLVGTRLH
jgi:hypothetical protein